MSPAATVRTTELPFPLHARGKVRDVYDVGDNRLLLVATDRISAFDVVMTQAIPSKGEVLTQVTAWWLEKLADVVPNHLISVNPYDIVKQLPALEPTFDVWAWRSTLVRRTTPFPVECVVRGYISGSAWKEYRDTGTLAGEEMPKGLRESSRLDVPIFSPATKAEEGHDENIPFSRVSSLIGNSMADTLRRISLEIYEHGRDIAEKVGIIIADTKFEFGTAPDGTLLLIDEVLTPDSSRFWPRDAYAEGRGQPSLDKQPVRDYLEALVQAGKWKREPPPPDLTPEVVQTTSARYRNVYERLTGSTLEQNRERAK